MSAEQLPARHQRRSANCFGSESTSSTFLKNGDRLSTPCGVLDSGTLVEEEGTTFG